MHELFEDIDLERFEYDGNPVLLCEAFLFNGQSGCGTQDEGNAHRRGMCFELLFFCYVSRFRRAR